MIGTVKPNIKVRIEHRRGGKLIGWEEQESDLVLDDGLNYICEVVGNPTQPVPMKYTAIGEDSTAASSNQSGLLAEVMREENTYSKDATVGEASLDCTFTITASGYSLNETGLVNTSGVGSSGIFLCRDVFSTTRNVISGDEITVYYTLQFTRP